MWSATTPRLLLVALLCLLSLPAFAQTLGQFENHTDVGPVLHPGSTTYNPADDTYTLTGSGSNLWFTADEMQFAFKRLHGDVRLTAAIDFVGAKGNNHRKAALMIRQSLDPGAPYADVARHGDGLTSLQFRLTPGDVTREIETAVTAPHWVRLERRGDTVFVLVGDSLNSLKFSGASIPLHLSGDLYVGLAICSHDKDVSETALFHHLTIEPLPPATTRGQLWSTLETVKAASSDRRVAYTAPVLLSDPTWSPDGASITLQQAATTQRFVLDPAPYPSLSPLQAAAKHPEPALSAPKAAITPAQQPSPDGKTSASLVFTNSTPASTGPQPAELRLFSLSDRQPHLLATFLATPSSFAAPAWSPDGTRLVFISYTYLP